MTWWELTLSALAGWAAVALVVSLIVGPVLRRLGEAYPAPWDQ